VFAVLGGAHLLDGLVLCHTTWKVRLS
jgi:hypothetical protein